MKNFLLLLLLIITNFNVVSQEVKLFKNFGVNNPMSYLFIRSFAQDKNGFMWFGSQEGLHRFDGYKLLSFHHDSAVSSSLSSNVVSRIFIDKNDQLWVGTRGGGLNLYREKSKDFFRITTKTSGASLSNNSINALLEDKQGNIWIGTENGLNILSHENNIWSVKQIFQELGNSESLSHNTVHTITETNGDQIWVGTNGGGISVFDLDGNFVKAVKLGDKNTSTYTNKFVNSLYYDKKDNVWIGTVDHGLLKYDLKMNVFKHYQYSETNENSIVSDTIETIYQDSSQKIWIATDKGLSIYNEQTDDFSRFTHAPNNPYSLSNDFVLTFFEDKNHLMWIGTFTGVNRWDPNMATFSQFNTQTNPKLTNNNITSFAQAEADAVFFSTYSGGIYQLSTIDNKISRIDFNGFFSELRVMSLFADNNTLWAGTRASGLYQIDLKTKAIKSYKNDEQNKNSISANSITDIIKDNQGNIWVSTFHQGINKLNGDGSFTRYPKNDDAIELGPSSNHILQLLEDDQGIIWLATYGGGLNRFDPKAETFIHIRQNEADPAGLTSDLAWVLLQDNDNNLWVGTQAAGINILSHENMLKQEFSFEHLDTKDGMKSLTVYGITQDSFGDIWFSSSKGISRYSPIKKDFKHFDLSHGLVDLEYNHGSVFKSLDNSLYFGAGKGLTSVHPDKINSNQLAPEVRLTNVLKLNEPMTFNFDLSQLSSLELDYSDQLISFEYVGLNYANPESTRYKYRLLGFDQEWINAGKSRRATYTNLPSGSYTLEIIAGNNDDVWSDPGYALAITVKPAPWNTWWAYLLYAILIALSLLTYSRILNRKLVIEQQQKTALKEQVIEKTKGYSQKNLELEQANKQLENAAIIDKLTGVKSRRYLDIYIEQTSQLMNQLHHNILPIQRSILPRLYVLMVQVGQANSLNNSQLINLSDLLLYSRNTDDLVIRWSDDTFAVIGYEKDNNAGELAIRLSSRLEQLFEGKIRMNIAYSFYPFNREQPVDLSWDQVSVMIELALSMVAEDDSIHWLGFCAPAVQPFNYLQVIQQKHLLAIKQSIAVKQG